MKGIKIGNVAVPNNILLAPLAGVTDKSFRSICQKFGAGLTYSEMVSAKSIVYGNANTKRLLDNDSGEKPWAVQLFGHEPDVFSEAIKRLEDVTFDIVDINMGCPVPKVVKNGEGSALMNNPVLAGRIIEAAVKASPRPVTVKIRKGFSPSRVNAAEIARVAEESGASAVVVHGRTRDQLYSGEADWNVIACVKRAARIPVIGNGDIFNAEAAVRRLNESGCDGIMVARGAMGNPWIFSAIRTLLETGRAEAPPDINERIRAATEHLLMTVTHKGDAVGISEMRKHLAWYVKGLRGASALRVQLFAAQTVAEIVEILGGQPNYKNNKIF